MQEIRVKILQSLIDPSIYDTITKLYKQQQANPQQFPNFVTNPQEMQVDFKEAYHRFAERVAYLMQFTKDNFPGQPKMQQDQHLIMEIGTFYLNWQAFLSTINMLGSPAQVDFWARQIYDHRIMGGYAQTEIGHGSNVQNLELTAHYNQETDSFTLNSPSASAYKFWPGLIGIFSTHAVCQAQTYVNGKHIGLQTFVVPIRDPKTFECLPNVEAGDIGPKLGFLKADNGYLGFRNHVIPRDFMLMRYVQLEKSGSVTKLSKDAIKFGYGSMLNLRVQLVFNFTISALSINNLAMGQLKRHLTTEHHEFSAVSFKLLRSYVVNYAILIANLHLKRVFETYQDQLQSNDPLTSATLQMAHLCSSQMKSLAAWESIKTSREAIQLAPFGHLNASYIINYYSDNIPYSTYEGDNNVLLQQTSQYLVKQFRNVAQGQKVKGIAEYFNNFTEECFDASFLADNRKIEKALESLSFQFTKFALTSFQSSVGEGLQKAWNEIHQSDLIKMSQIFGYTNIYKFLLTQVESLKPHIGQEATNLLNLISNSFGCFLILEFRPLIVAFKIATVRQLEILKRIDDLIPNRLEFLTKSLEGINMMRLQTFYEIDWSNLKLQPKL